VIKKYEGTIPMIDSLDMLRDIGISGDGDKRKEGEE